MRTIMNKSIKTTLILSALSGSLCLSSAYAASAASSGSSSGGSSQIQVGLLADIDGILHATAKTASNMTYQLDQFLASIESSNTAPSRLSGSAPLSSSNLTADNSTDSSTNSSTKASSWGFSSSNSSNSDDTTGKSVSLNANSLGNYVNFRANEPTYRNTASTLARANATINNSTSTTAFELNKSNTNPWLNAFFQGDDTDSTTSSTSSSSDTTPKTILDITSQLTTETPASDSLYFIDAQSQVKSGSNTAGLLTSSTQADAIAKPTKNFDSYMTASTFFSPYNGSYFTPADGNTAYSPQAAKAYLAYLTAAYAPLGSQVRWDLLDAGSISGASGGFNESERARDIYTVKTSTFYQAYQLTMRRMMTLKSGVSSVLNYLYSERYPSSTLAQQAKLPPAYTTKNYISSSDDDATGNAGGSTTASAKVTASPLQYENYIANHRVNSHAWYQSMSTASPATVQRETLFVLAAILSKMQQAHMDRERQMFLTTLQLNSQVSAVGQNLRKQTDALNTMISNLPGVSNPGPAVSDTNQTTLKKEALKLNFTAG